MFEVHLCPTSPNYVKLRDISPYAIHAIIASEDGSFYSHKGFDWHEMEASFNANLHSGKIRRGGSTLTQQLAKNVFLNQEKSLWRKAKEAYLADAIERNFDKQFILEKYLNVVEFGPNIYGIKPASLHYFHKNPQNLNPLESAYLAFLLPNPKVYSKSFNSGHLTAFGQKMVHVILRRMSSFGKLPGEAYRTAVAEIPNFPWSHLTSESFLDSPAFSLEATQSNEITDDGSVPDEDAVEDLMNEQDQMSADPTADPDDSSFRDDSSQ